MNDLLPRYYQIKQTIKNWIISREFNPGDKIPSENQLSEIFNVTRLTVRQALAQLIQEGFITSRKGGGTYVTSDENLINSFNIEFTGFMDDLFYQVSKSKTKSVEINRITIPKSMIDKLALGRDDEIILVKRVRLKKDTTFAYTINYLPVEIGEKLNKKDLLKKPLLQILEQDLGIKFTEAFQTIEASFADQEVSRLLEIPAGSPLLFVERIMYTKRRKPVEVVQSLYRGDCYKYIVRLKTVRRKNGNVWMYNT
jgi:GntR family transcriptional regulator